MATIFDISLWLGLLALVVYGAARIGKASKVMSVKRSYIGWAAAGFLALALVGGATPLMGSIFQAAQTQAPPTAGGLFQVSGMLGVTTGLTNTATISETDAVNGLAVDWYDTAANWITTVGGDDFAITVDVINLNVGSSTQVYAADYKLSSVGTVKDQTSGNNIPLILLDANGFNTVTYTQGTTVAAVLTQTHDTARETFPTGDSDTTMNVDATINAGAFNAMVAGQAYAVVYSIAGVSCTLTFHAL